MAADPTPNSENENEQLSRKHNSDDNENKANQRYMNWLEHELSSLESFQLR